MTVQTTTSKVIYNADGVLVEYPFTFITFDADSIQVFISNVQIGEFSVLLNPDQSINPGGAVTLDEAPESDESIAIVRVEDQVQLVDYQPFDSFPAETHERALDRLTMMVQQLDEQVDRAYKAPIDTAPGEDFVFPPYDPGKLIGWSETEENVLANSPQSFADFVAEADRAEAAADSSESWAQNSSVSAQLSQDFANEDEDVPVQGNLFSAKHYAIKALKAQSGLNLIAIISGDDLCPKPGDINSPVACNAPDHRNPGERFNRGHQQGDYYLISAPGNMSLKDPGDPFGPETTQLVGVGDYIIFVNDITDIIGEGFYKQESLSGGTTSADLVSFDDTGTEIKGTSVQVWNEAADTKIAFAFDAISAVLGGLIGSVQMFAIDRPSDALWIYCNGQAVSRIDFVFLFSKIGTMYGDGDGSTTFNLPDYRGQFMRGEDDGAGEDPDAANRTNRGDGTVGDEVGTRQGHEFNSHQHGVAGDHQHVASDNHSHTATQGTHNHSASAAEDNGNLGGRFTRNSRGQDILLTTEQSSAGAITIGQGGAHTHPATGDHQHAAAGGAETRPVNVYVRWYMFTGLLP